MNDDATARGRSLLSRADAILVFTGAGVSAESGVPTFRGTTGLWSAFRPEEIATPQAFARDPQLVWGWYAWRREMVAACVPNPAHRAIAAAMARRGDIVLVTQNVDDLHERAAREAGAPAGPPRLRRLHGALFADRCRSCDFETAGGLPDTGDLDALPRCPECGDLLRPGVVWYGEALPESELNAAFAAAETCDVCLVVGTSGTVYPAAGIVHAARAAGASLVIVDPGETAFDAVADVRVTGSAGDVLPLLLAAD